MLVGGWAQSTQRVPQLGGEPFGPGSQLPFHTQVNPAATHSPMFDPSGYVHGSRLSPVETSLGGASASASRSVASLGAASPLSA